MKLGQDEFALTLIGLGSMWENFEIIKKEMQHDPYYLNKLKYWNIDTDTMIHDAPTEAVMNQAASEEATFRAVAAMIEENNAVLLKQLVALGVLDASLLDE